MTEVRYRTLAATCGAGVLAALVMAGQGCGLLVGVGPLSGEESGKGGAGGAGNVSGAGAGSGSGAMGSGTGGAGGACFECLEPLWTQSLRGTLDQLADDVALDGQGNTIFAGSLVGTAEFQDPCPEAGTATCPMTSSGGNDVFVAKVSPSGKPLWSTRFGDSDEQVASGVAVDKDDNMVVVGTFRGTINPGGGLLSSANLMSFDVFVASFAPDGTHLKSNRFGDIKNQFAQGVAADAAGNVIVAGFFESKINFGGSDLSATGSFDIFVAKLGSDLSHVWSKRFGTLSASRALAVAVDASGNILLTGRFQGTIDFGKGQKTSPSTDDLFIAKLAPDGSEVWSKVFGGPGTQEGRSIRADQDGNVLVTGSFEGTLDFVTGDNPTLAGTDGLDTFVVKLNKDTGDAIWSRSFGSLGDQIGEGIATSSDGHVFVTGSMAGESIPFAGTSLVNAGLTDAFVLTFDAAGTPLCGVRFGDDKDQGGKAIAVDPQGQVVLAANQKGKMDLGCGLSATSTGANDVLIGRFKP